MGSDPGPIRVGTDARGWIQAVYKSQVDISDVRLLLGPGSSKAPHDIVLFPPGELGDGPRTIGPVSAGGGWVSLAGPNPCLP